jgi:hypothetical protein
MERRRENRDLGIDVKKEIKALKVLECKENALIARNVRLYQKRQLIDKQLEVDD